MRTTWNMLVQVRYNTLYITFPPRKRLIDKIALTTTTAVTPPVLTLSSLCSSPHLLGSRPQGLDTDKTLVIYGTGMYVLSYIAAQTAVYVNVAVDEKVYRTVGYIYRLARSGKGGRCYYC